MLGVLQQLLDRVDGAPVARQAQERQIQVPEHVRQGVIDLVGHSGGQRADAHQAFRHGPLALGLSTVRHVASDDQHFVLAQGDDPRLVTTHIAAELRRVLEVLHFTGLQRSAQMNQTALHHVPRQVGMIVQHLDGAAAAIGQHHLCPGPAGVDHRAIPLQVDHEIREGVEQSAVHAFAAAELVLGVARRKGGLHQLPFAFAELCFLARQLLDHVARAAHHAQQAAEAGRPAPPRRQRHVEDTSARGDRGAHFRRWQPQLFRHRGEGPHRHPQNGRALTVGLGNVHGDAHLVWTQVLDVELDDAIGAGAEPTNRHVEHPSGVHHEGGHPADLIEQTNVGDLSPCAFEPRGAPQQLAGDVAQLRPVVPRHSGTSVFEHVARDGRTRDQLVQVQ